MTCVLITPWTKDYPVEMVLRKVWNLWSVALDAVVDTGRSTLFRQCYLLSRVWISFVSALSGRRGEGGGQDRWKIAVKELPEKKRREFFILFCRFPLLFCSFFALQGKSSSLGDDAAAPVPYFFSVSLYLSCEEGGDPFFRHHLCRSCVLSLSLSSSIVVCVLAVFANLPCFASFAFFF